MKAQRYSLLSASPWTVILSIALATADNFAEPDLWIHMLTGQTTLRTGHIPRFDTYSYSAVGAPWHNHEWLSQVALAFFYAHLGVFGLKLLKLICSSILIVALAIGISATGAAARVQRLTLILSAVAISTQMQFRPQLFTFMMIAVVMMALAIEVYRGRAVLWPLIPMFTLWANFHGGYIVGLGAMGIAAAVMFVQGWFGDADRMRSAWRLGLITVGCAAATVINPFGVGLWFGVAHSVGDPLIRQVIADWVPLPKMILTLWRSSPIELLQYATPILLFAGFAGAVALAPDLGDAAMLAVATIFIGAAFYATRNVAIGVIAVAIPLARHAGLALEGGGAQQADDGDLPAALLAICAIAVALVGGTLSNRLKTWKPMPTGALAFMQQHKLHGNLLPQFEWGSYVLWHMGDEFKVYIDPRGELVFTDKQEGDYARFFYGMPGSEQLLEAYPHDYVLMGVNTKGADLVKKDPHWHLLYSDQTAALFGRAEIPGVGPVVGNVGGPDGKAAATYFP
ncbi:hypothetical protein [Candidatus Binatus sp.]|uniref:hypothetical protein n=2 Tax=Candidatus Binatus sp. TaxID=2811406 RepID=UPI003C4077EE